MKTRKSRKVKVRQFIGGFVGGVGTVVISEDTDCNINQPKICSTTFSLAHQ